MITMCRHGPKVMVDNNGGIDLLEFGLAKTMQFVFLFCPYGYAEHSRKHFASADID